MVLVGEFGHLRFVVRIIHYIQLRVLLRQFLRQTHLRPQSLKLVCIPGPLTFEITGNTREHAAIASTILRRFHQIGRITLRFLTKIKIIRHIQRVFDLVIVPLNAQVISFAFAQLSFPFVLRAAFITRFLFSLFQEIGVEIAFLLI